MKAPRIQPPALRGCRIGYSFGSMLVSVVLAGAMGLGAEYALAEAPATAPSQPAVRNMLPQDHESQEHLSAFMAMLLEKDRSHGVTEKSKSPFLHGENFIRVFEKDFIGARQPGFAAIIHAGPIGVQAPDDNKARPSGPMAMGGGQLSAFWTPATGLVILGLRGGTTLGALDSWETWPIHAISGTTGQSKVFTSARIAKPEVVSEIKDAAATVTVSGQIPAIKVVKNPAADPEKAGIAMSDDDLLTPGSKIPGFFAPPATKINYTRTFKITGKGVRVETTVSGDGKVGGTFETIPVYLGAGQEQKTNANVKIEVQRGNRWTVLTEQGGGAKTIRITRFGHAVLVTFDKGRTVRLAPADWTDKYPDKYATCRNILILLEEGAEFAFGAFVNFADHERKICYEITPVAEPVQ